MRFLKVTIFSSTERVLTSKEFTTTMCLWTLFTLIFFRRRTKFKMSLNFVKAEEVLKMLLLLEMT